jgi:nucleotide-binding universal stress UspA family protein
MTNFVVPIDFSEDSLKGLEWAILFSQKKSVNIQMVYVISNPSNFQASVMDLEQKYADAHFGRLIKEYAPRLANDSQLSYELRKGKIYHEIVDLVNSQQDAVVSASTHGASGFEELFIGSNALKIIAATDQPVFTLRTHVPSDIRKIVVPIKLHPDTRQKAPAIAEIARLFDAEVHLVSISTSKNERDLMQLESYSNQVERYLATQRVKAVQKNLSGESLPNLINNYCEAVDADLIAIMSSAIDKWNVLLGSFAQQMVKSTRVPLLNITPNEKHIPADFGSPE